MAAIAREEAGASRTAGARPVRVIAAPPGQTACGRPCCLRGRLWSRFVRSPARRRAPLRARWRRFGRARPDRTRRSTPRCRAARRCGTAMSCRDLRRRRRRFPIRRRRRAFGEAGSNAMSEMFRPTPRLPALSKVTPQSVETKQAAALRAGEPVARVVRRLLDVQDLQSGRARAAPRRAAVLAAEQPLFVARHQTPLRRESTRMACVIFAVQSGGRVAPGDAAVVADPDAPGVSE